MDYSPPGSSVHGIFQARVLEWGRTELIKVKPQAHSFLSCFSRNKCFPGGSDAKEPACNAGDPGSTPGLGRSPGEGNGNPLHYSCLENPMDRGAWGATVQRVSKSWTTEATSTLNRMRNTLARHGICPKYIVSGKEIFNVEH